MLDSGVEKSFRIQQKNEARQPYKGLRWSGFFLALLGISAIVASFTATMAAVLIFGVFLIMAGILHLYFSYIFQTPDVLWRGMTGLIYLLIGVILVIDPVNGAIGLTLLLGLLFLCSAVLRLALAATLQKVSIRAGWQFLMGMLNLLLAVLIFTGWPQTGTWVIGTFIGIELLLAGIALILIPDIKNPQVLL